MIIVLAFSNSTYAENGEDAFENPAAFDSTGEYLKDEKFFESPNSLMMPEISGPEFDYSDYAFDRTAGGSGNYKDIDPNKLPLFKKMRLTLQYKLSSEMDKREKRIESGENKGLLQRLQFWKKSEEPIENLSETEKLTLSEKGSIVDSIQNEVLSEDKDSDAIALESGISTHVTEKELVLDADKVVYDEDTGDMVAHGRPVLDFPQQGLKVISDTMLYNQDSNVLKGNGDVVVLKGQMPIKADSFEIDMNEETMLMSSISAYTEEFIMDSEKAMQKDSKLIFENGYLHSDVSNIHRFHSRMVGPRFWNMIIEPENQSLFLSDPTGSNLHLDIDEIQVDARSNHNKYVAKNIKISKNGKHKFTWRKMTIFTDKEGGNFEANYPEFGTKRKLGMFAGPGFVFGGPGGSVIKAIPMVNYSNSNFGLGGLLKYRNTYNTTYMGYGSANDIFVMKGRQRLDDNLFLQYSANSYNDEWFLGSRMPKYGVEVYYDKKHNLKDFFAEGKHLSFRHRVGMGVMQDNNKNYHGERLGGGHMSTARFRYMAELAQTLYSYTDEEKRLYFNLSLAMQGSAAVYGNGDTQFIGRIGPRAHLQYKNWMQDIAYYQSGFEDETPMPRYDKYRYGASSVYISEIFRISKYLSVGWAGLANLSDDSPNGKIFQENRFVVAVGPDDLKVRFGYDFYRQTTFFGFDVSFDTKGTSISYGKMEIKNPERLKRKKSDSERQLAFIASQQQKEQKEQEVANKMFGKAKSEPKTKVLQYAQVINIEDPNKETID